MHVNVEGFINALAVFVRENCNRLANIATTDTLIVCKESDPLWVEGFLVALHLSL